MRRAACSCNHLITVAFGAFSKAEQLIGVRWAETTSTWYGTFRASRISAVNCMVAQSLLDPITMAIRAELLRKTCVLKLLWVCFTLL